MWDEYGQQLKIENPLEQIQADPRDVNILPGYGSDPRTVDKLVDGNHWTCDDLHVWLAPFTEGQKHSVTIDLLTISVISVIRIWNYNKSRIHSFRGAKNIEILLDNTMVFHGEISQAPGRITNADAYAEYILFTKDEMVLKEIDLMDWVGSAAQANNSELDMELMTTIRMENRPGTGSKNEEDLYPKLTHNGMSLIGEDGRPLTIALTEADLPKIP